MNDISRVKIYVLQTSIAVKFCHDEFSRQYTPTSGIDFYMKNLHIGKYKNVTIYMWDTSGLSLRSKLLDKYIFGANVRIFFERLRNEIIILIRFLFNDQ